MIGLENQIVKVVSRLKQKEILEKQIEILLSAQEKCLETRSCENVVPIAKTIVEITILLERYSDS